MANLYQFSENEILSFVLVLIRVSGFVVAWPIFGVRTVPAPVKILFSLVLALLIFPTLPDKSVGVDFTSLSTVWVAIIQLVIGLCIGFLARMFLYAVHIAGQIISVSMGLANAQLFNPSLGNQAATVEQFHIVLATLFFLAIQGHHLLIKALVDSFDLIPLNVLALGLDGFGNVVPIIEEIMAIGVRLGAPVMLSILFMNIAMGIIGRAIPQINVLITSLPVNILVGFLVIMASIPMLFVEMNGLVESSTLRIFQFLKDV